MLLAENRIGDFLAIQDHATQLRALFRRDGDRLVIIVKLVREIFYSNIFFQWKLLNRYYIFYRSLHRIFVYGFGFKLFKYMGELSRP